MLTSRTKLHTKKSSKLLYAGHPNWQAKKNQLAREGTILRWRVGNAAPNVQVGRVEPEEKEDKEDADTTLAEQRERQSEYQENMKIRLLFERARSLYFNRIGGLRTEPFNALPIPSKGEVPETFDFLAQHWSHYDMSDMRRGPDGRPILYSTYFATLLHDPMVFEVMMAFCMLVQSLKRGSSTKLSPEALCHSANCVAILRERLQASGGEGISDMVLCTIVVLGSIALAIGDFKSLEFHATGMARIIVLRGGHDRLGWDGYVATRCRQLEGGWLSVQKLEKDREQSGASSVDELVYPKHPFSTELCSRLAQIPPGFSDLVVQGKLSLRFLSIIEAVTTWELNSSIEATTTSPGSLPAMFLAVPDQTQIEALLALSLLAYCAHAEKRLGKSQPAFEGSLEFYSKDIISDTEICALKSEDAFVWAALMLVGTTERGTEICKWAYGMLDEIKPNGAKRQELGKRFFTIAVQ